MPDVNDTGTAAKTEARQDAPGYGADTFANVAQTMADVARLAMDQGQEAIRLCLNTMSAQAPVGESSYARGRQMMANGALTLETYREFLDRSMDDVQAMMNSYAHLGRGVRQWQRTYTDAVRQTFDKFGDKPQELPRCTSVADAARLQRDLYLDVIGGMMAYNIAALQVLSQSAQEALRPLQERGRRSQ